jgi:hypothetical protein
MWKLDKSIHRVLVIWIILFIASSLILTISFCYKNAVFLFYHLFFTPIYYIIGYVLLLIFISVIRYDIKMKMLAFMIFWSSIVIILWLLQDFQSSLCFGKSKDCEISFTNIIHSGCREMFFLLSTLISSLIVSFKLNRVFNETKSY